MTSTSGLTRSLGTLAGAFGAREPRFVDEAVAVAPRFQSSSATGGAVGPPSRTTGISTPCLRGLHSGCLAPWTCDCDCGHPAAIASDDAVTVLSPREVYLKAHRETRAMLSPAACELRDRIVKAIGLADYAQRIVEVETLISKRENEDSWNAIQQLLK